MIETINQINKEIAKELSLNESIVKAVNKFYWEKGIKDSIRSAKHTSIRIRGIGTIASSRRKLRNSIEYLIKQIRYLRSTTKEFKTSKEDLIQAKYDLLGKFLARRNELANTYYKKQQRISEYKRNNPKENNNV